MSEIKFNEIFDDQGEIDKLIAKIKALNEEYKKMAGDIQKQAAKSEEKLNGINIATSGGKEELKKSAREADELLRAYKALDRAMSENNKTIKEVKENTKTVNRIRTLEAKIAVNTKGSYNALSAEMSSLKLRYKQLTEEEIKNTAEGKKLTKRINEINTTLKRLDSNVGVHTRNVGNYKESIIEAFDATGAFGQQLGIVSRLQRTHAAGTAALASIKMRLAGATGTATTGLKAFRLALISTGIGAIVVVLGTLIAAFVSTQRGIDAVNKVLIPLKTVFKGLWGVIQDLSLRGFDRLAEAIENPKKAFEDLGRVIKENVIAKFKTLSMFSSGLSKILDGELKEGLLEVGIAAGELTGFNGAAKAIGGFTKETEEAIKKNLELGQRIHETKIALREEEIAFELRREQLRNTIAEERALASDQQKTAAQRAASLKRAMQANNELAKGEESLAKKRVKLAELEAQANDTDAEARLNIEKLKADLLRTQTDAFNRSKEIISLGSRLNKQAAKEEADALIKQLELKKKTELAKLQAERDFGNESIDEKRRRDKEYFLKEQELTFAILEEKRRLNMLTEQEFALASIEQTVALKEFYANQQKVIDNALAKRLAAFEKNYKALAAMAEKEALDRVVSISKNLGKKAVDAVKSLKLDDGAPGDFWDMLGFRLTDKQRDKIKSTFDFAKQQMASFFNSYKSLAAQRVADSNRVVAAAENELNRQTALQAAGVANTAESSRKELQIAKARQKQALENQRKAAAAEMAVQSALQASNLALGIAKLWTKPGWPLALPLTAVLLGSFATAKIKAFQLAKKREFKKGGLEFLDYGGSHASGNDIPLGPSKDGKTMMAAERGEAFAVINRANTVKYRPLLPLIIDSLNKGVFEQKFMNLAAAGRDLPIVNVGGSMDTSRMEGHLAAIRRQGEVQYTKDGDGNLVEVSGNRKIIYVD